MIEALLLNCQDYYGLFVALGEAVVLAGRFALAALLVLPVAELLAVLVPALAFVAGVGDIAGVGDGLFALALALFAGRFALLAASPQAMPIALKPRTVESTITFFILFTDS